MTVDETDSSRPAGARLWLRWALGLFYFVAGVFHLARPYPFMTITPSWVPWPDWVVLATGLAELAAAPALLQPWSARLRRVAGIALAVYAICVFPANINHMLLDTAKPDPVLGWGYHIRDVRAAAAGVVGVWVSGAKTGVPSRPAMSARSDTVL